jgi:translation initiation factor 1 (eIF-1/SUI1)
VVDDFGGADPTTVIRVDGLHFTRLCGGRIKPGDVEIQGDYATGRRIVENLNYVI